MAWTLSPVALVVFGSGLIALVVAIAALRRRPDSMAGPLVAMMVGVVTWAVPHAISLGFADLESVLLWQRLTYPGAAVAPVAYLVVALAYTGHDRWLSRRTYAALLIVPAMTVVVVWTAPYHDLFWRSPSIVEVTSVSVLVFDRGPWYWVTLTYLYGVSGVGVLLFATRALRSGPIYSKQAGLMFVGGVVPLVTNVVTVFVLPGPVIDLTTPALAVTGITFALALFYLDLLSVRPVARDQLVEELDDGVVVIGPDGRVRDFNQTAELLIEDIAIDTPVEEILPDGTLPDRGEIAVEIDGRERLFRTRSTTLSEEGGRSDGRIIHFNEVTDIVEREQRISVLNRVLRHNIRNELNVAAGHLDVMSDRVSDRDRENIETATKSVQRVITLAEKARNLERTLRQREADRAVSASEAVERVVADAREQFDDAVIEFEPPDDDAEIRVVEGSFFEMALAELLENGVVHNDREHPRVTVTVDPRQEAVNIRVADDGPGIPEAEWAALRTHGETDLEHMSGLGLWLVTWTVSLSGGDITFAENDPRGSVVTLSLPAPDT